MRWSRVSRTGRRLHRRFGPPCTAAWAGQDGPAASHHRFDAAPATGFRQSIATDPADATTSRPAGSRMDCGINRSRTAVARVRFASCPRPDGAAYKSRNRASWPVVVWAAGADLPRLSRGERQRPTQARATRTRNPWHRAPETVSSHGRELSRLPASSATGGEDREEQRKRGTRCSVREPDSPAAARTVMEVAA
jgi:hypothetical protein